MGVTEGVSSDEWERLNIQSFVGAMKIARNVVVPGRRVEWYSPTVPGSLSEGAGSPQGLTEGVSSDGCFVPMVIRKPSWALKFLSFYVHRSTLPQLRCAQQLPQRGSREGAHHSPDCSLISGVGGRFSSPLRNSKDFTFHHSSGDTPSVSLSLTAPSGREPGNVPIQPGTR